MLNYCAVCGKLIPAGRKKSNSVKYCSEACLRKAEAKKKMDLIADRTARISKVALAVYEAYGSKCALCGWQATPDLIAHKGKIQFAHGNEIHHIRPVSEGGTEDPDNVILLCPNHHKQADLGIITTEELKQHVVNYIEEAEERKKNRQCEATVASLIFDDTSEAGKGDSRSNDG